jgi:hypothetical protein
MPVESTPHLSAASGFFRVAQTFGLAAVELQSDCWRQFSSFSGMATGNSAEAGGQASAELRAHFSKKRCPFLTDFKTARAN